MRAVRIRQPGGPEVLELVEVPEPEPGPEEILVRVVAAGLNRADLMQRRGGYPAPAGAPQEIPGLELAGTVVAVGSSAHRFAVGDRVMGLVGGGACAEKAVLHERAAIPVPGRLSWEQAAAIPEAFFTAFDALLLQARLAPGEWLLIHAVGSGVGTAATQIARLVGARAIGTARTEKKVERARGLGLHAGLTLAEPVFADAVQRVTSGAGADVILDLVGASYFPENVRALAPQGRLILVGLVGGASAQLSLGTLLAKRATVRGTVLRARPIEEKLALARAFERQMLPAFESGALFPIVERVYPMADIAAAHAAMEASATFGKLVLVW